MVENIEDGDSVIIFVKNVVKVPIEGGIDWFSIPARAIEALRELAQFDFREAKESLNISRRGWIGIPVQYYSAYCVNEMVMLGYQVKILDWYNEVYLDKVKSPKIP